MSAGDEQQPQDPRGQERQGPEQDLDLQGLMEEGVATGVFTDVQAELWRGGEVLFSGAASAQAPGASAATAPASTTTSAASPSTTPGRGAASAALEAPRELRFDLASLTKPMATTAAFMALWAEGKVGPHTTLRMLGWEGPAADAGVTLGDLLYHRSGLPAWMPYFARAMPAVPELFQPGCPASVRAEVRAEVVTAAAKTQLARQRATEAVYSDVGFILLGEALARVAGVPLETLYRDKVKGPLGLESDFRPLSSSRAAGGMGRGEGERAARSDGGDPARRERQGIEPPFARTGDERPRPPAPGQETRWEPFGTRPSAPGEVDDDNAWVMDGVSGHAGLFGTARDVARFGQYVLEEHRGAGRLAPGPLWQRALACDASTPGSGRALGFDTPTAGSDGGSSSLGSRLGVEPPFAVGHLAFTGCSLWIDLARGVVVSLVCNRVATNRTDPGPIRALRRRFHEAAGVLALSPR